MYTIQINVVFIFNINTIQIKILLFSSTEK